MNQKGATVDDLAVYMPRRDVEELLGVIRDRLAHAAVSAQTGELKIGVAFDRGIYSRCDCDPGIGGRGRRTWGPRDRSS